MRYIILALIIATLPIFITCLRQAPQLRGWALAGITLTMMTVGDEIRLFGSLVTWPMWNGIAKGYEISPVDTLSLALILTRSGLPKKLPFWGVLGAYGAIISLSLFVSSVPMATSFAVYNYGRLLIVFVAVAGELHRDASRRGLLAGLSLGLLIQAGYVAREKMSGVVQAAGSMFHQNTLGMMTELALIALLSSLLAGDRRKITWAGVLAALFVIAGGGSRGAIAVASGGAAVLIALSLARGVTQAKLRVLGLAFLGLLVVVPIGLATLKDRFGQTSVLFEEDQRAAFERAARAMAADHILGVGANMYVPTANLQGYAVRAGVDWNPQNRSKPVHNAYLLSRAETGLLGEFLLILLLAWPMIQGLRFAFRYRNGLAGEIALGSAVAIGTNIVHNNFEFAFFSFNVTALVFIHFALIAACIRDRRLAESDRNRSRKNTRQGGPLAPSLSTESTQ